VSPHALPRVLAHSRRGHALTRWRRARSAVMLDWPESIALHIVMGGALYLCYYCTTYVGLEIASAVQVLRGAPTILEPQRAL
jgi:hypothetical protein